MLLDLAKGVGRGRRKGEIGKRKKGKGGKGGWKEEGEGAATTAKEKLENVTSTIKEEAVEEISMAAWRESIDR